MKGDPILYFLNSKLKLNPIMVAILSIIIAAIMIPWAIQTEVFWSGKPNSIYLSLYDSYHTWIGDIVLGVTNGLILYYYLSFPRLFKSLYQHKIIDDGTNDFNSLFTFFSSQIFNKKRHLIVLIVSLICAIIMQCLWLYGDEGGYKHGWTEISAEGGMSYLGYYHFFYFTLEFSILINFLVNVYYTIILFRKLEKKVIVGDLKYNFVRLCQYKTGGLKSLGDIAMRIIMVLFTLGIYISLIVFSIIKHTLKTGTIDLWKTPQISLLFVYVIIAPLIFFLLLTPIHKLMIRKKNELYKLLIKKDTEVITLEKKSLQKLFINSNSIEKIRINNELFKLINELPTWPFNLSSISKLITMTILPILPIILELIINNLTD